MIRDKGPYHNLGFGMPLQEGEERGTGNASFVEKALDGHPVMRFFTVAGASMLSMALAGKVTRGAGLRFAESLQQVAHSKSTLSDMASNAIMSFRKIEDILDSLQGVNRDIDKNDILTLVKREDGKLVRDRINIVDSYQMRYGRDDIEKWSMRHELQQRLITQARRIPYEAPGFYVAQKALLDPLFGTDNEKNNVNWKNPFDVVGDFAFQTVKNLAINVAPFDAALGIGKSQYRSYINKALTQPGSPSFNNFVTVQTMLGQMGVDFAGLMDRTVKLSHQSIGAFSTMVTSAHENSLSFGEFIKTRKNAALTLAPEYANSGYARRMFLQAKDFVHQKDARRQLIDTLPKPFKGMGTASVAAKEKFKRVGQTYDDWQSVLSGHETLEGIRRKSESRYADVKDFMLKGSGTHIEQFATAADNLGKGGPVLSSGKINSKWYDSQFRRSRINNIYKQTLAEELSNASGLDLSATLKFVKTAEHISPLQGARAPASGTQLIERFRYTTSTFQGRLGLKPEENLNDWWNTLIKGVKAHGIVKDDSLTLDIFQRAVKQADYKFGSPSFKGLLERRIQNEWKNIHGQLIAPEATKALSSIRRPFELFSDQNLENNREYLAKRVAARLGIGLSDNTGNPIPTEHIYDSLRKRGFNPDNLKKLRGFLVDKKEIAAPWSIGGSNLFGFKPLSVEQAMRNQYFGGHPKSVQDQISLFVTQKTFSPIVGRGSDISGNMDLWDLKINKVFVSSNNKVIDFGRFGRSIIAGINKVQSEFQIPLIHLKPLQMGGWSSFQAMKNSPAVMVAPGFSTQPIALAAGKEFKTPDFYLYMKSSAKASKGKVVGISSSLSGQVEHAKYDGLFRPFTTNVQNMLGRYGNIIFGEKDVPSSRSHKQAWKRLFDVSFEQENDLAFGEDSLLRRWRRARKRDPRSFNNHFIAAEAIGSEAFKPENLTPELSGGVDNLIKAMRGFRPSPKTLKSFSEINELKDIFSVDFGNGPLNLLDIGDNVLPQIVKIVLDKDRQLLKSTFGLDSQQVGKLQQQLRTMLREGEKQVNIWDLNVTSGVKSTGISRRIDQLKAEWFDYVLLRKGALDPSSDGIDDTAQRLMLHLEDLFSKGAISSSQKSEGRAAILSIVLENARNKTYKPGIIPIEHNMETLREVFDSKAINAKEILAEIGSGKTTNSGKPFRRAASKFFRQENYERPFQNNPTGTSTVFMPTFGTTFARNPVRAVAGAVGLSWRDPKAISGSQMPITHLSVRLNRYFENFGIGIDETRYKSPLDFYTRGIIGKRVLPIYAAGVTALAVDRTIGGALQEDQYGKPIYSPYFLGKAADVVAAGQVGLSAIIPGGQTGQQKREELESGEVPIRKGRYWILGNTPFKGGRIQYFRPSWYQRIKSGSSYTPEMRETPLERLLFGYDFSPLRPFDPYRREREDYNTRPYPVSGEYFTGPWGPLTSALNATVGKILKPSLRMHKEETKYALSQYAPVGESGAYFPVSPSVSGNSAANQLSNTNANYSAAGIGTPSSSPFYGSLGYTSPRGMASSMVRSNASNVNNYYSGLAGVPTRRGQMSPRVIAGQAPLDYSSLENNSRRLGYQSQELFGIYGFAAASVREGFGFGTKDFAPLQSILEPASRGYSSNRAFWNLQIGGLGDLPLPIEGKYANLEISEIIRRFVPKEPAGVNYINNIPNDMGKRYPWLPGVDYPLANIKSGDPYNAIPDAEIRLPGLGYARTHRVFPDQYGKLGIANIHDILGDIAPWSEQYKYVNTLVNREDLPPEQLALINQTRAQVEAMRRKNEFTPYEYKYTSPEQMVKHPFKFALGRGWEWLTHRDTYLNTKLGTARTALEDWERNNVYGATFPSWENPIQSFLKPAVYKSTQRNPLAAAASGASLGYLFGVSPQAKGVGAVLGGLIGASSSVYGKAYEGITGERFIPIERKKQAAVEEYVDILNYIRNARLSSQALRQGDTASAQLFENQARTTMFGVDFDKATPEKLAMAVPKRRREHFRSMLYAPVEEREQILSTAPRLERRLFQAAWGMPVEEKPDLREYFNEHELPPPDSEVWSPYSNMDSIKIKIGQSLGLDLAQMGFYPQQIQEANLLNPAYPNFSQPTGGHLSMLAKIKRFLFDNDIDATVFAEPSQYSGNRFQLNSGV